MKKGLLLLLFFRMLAGVAQVQFEPLRYNDSIVSDVISNQQKPYDRFKKLQLTKSNDTYINFGGEVRYQNQFYRNEDWGASPAEKYTAVYTRFLFHQNLQIRKRTRLFLQINSTTASGRVTGNRSIDQNIFDIQQAFFDLTPNSFLLLRIGRQEFLYGSQRIIGVREGPNNRQSFDAALVRFSKNKMRIDISFAYPVQIRQGIIDDRIQYSEKFWKAYGTYQLKKKKDEIALYYIGYQNSNKTYTIGTAKEIRHSVGSRLQKKSEPFAVDLESLYQFGNWNNQRIHAYTVSANLSYVLKGIPLKPVIGLKTELISGDKDEGDKMLNTFNPLFPRGAYFGLAALIGPSNLTDVHPSISLQPFHFIELNIDYDWFWRHRTSDGLYGPNTSLILGNQSRAKFIGRQLGISADVQPNTFIKFTPEIMWFQSGSYLKEVSPGKNVVFAAFTIQLKY